MHSIINCRSLSTRTDTFTGLLLEILLQIEKANEDNSESVKPIKWTKRGWKWSCWIPVATRLFYGNSFFHQKEFPREGRWSEKHEWNGVDEGNHAKRSARSNNESVPTSCVLNKENKTAEVTRKLVLEKEDSRWTWELPNGTTHSEINRHHFLLGLIAVSSAKIYV